MLKKIEKAEYNMCKTNGWANDLVSQYKDYRAYKNLGLGIVVLKDGEDFMCECVISVQQAIYAICWTRNEMI